MRKRCGQRRVTPSCPDTREHGDDPTLYRAYTKKRKLVEQMIAAMGSEAGIDAILQDTEESIAVLAAQLRDGPFATDPSRRRLALRRWV